MPKISQLRDAPILPLVGNEPFVVVQNGVTVKAPVDQIPINLSFPTIAALQAASPPAGEDSVYVEGYYASGDGGGHWRTRGTGAGQITDAAGDTWIVESKDANILYWGGVGDNSTNNDAAIAIAESSSYTWVYLPEGRYVTSLTSYQATNKLYYGPGQLIVGGYGAAHVRSFVVSEQPVPSTSRLQIFDNLTKVPNQSYRFVNVGANPSPLPVTYTSFPQWSQSVEVYDFAGGFNTDPSTHTLGRSGAFHHKDYVYHGGQGDMSNRSYYGEVYSHLSGATHFLANPALIVENGNLGVSSANGAGCYLNKSEYIFTDSGYAIAVISDVRNYIRTNGTSPLGEVWLHDRPQSAGSQPIDCFYSMSGVSKVGVDTTPADFGANKAAIAIKQQDRIYLCSSSTPDSSNAKWYADVVGTTYITTDASNNITATVDGVTSLTISDVEVSASVPLRLPSYTVGTLPSAATSAQLIYVSDGTSNKRLAVSDGTNWRWPDGAIVS